MQFINYDIIPKTRRNTITYARLVSAFRPLKTEQYRMRLTAGGNLIHCTLEKTTHMADVLLTKLFFNSVISTPKALFFTIYIKDFYLHNNLPYPEYMAINYDTIPEDIQQYYNLNDIVHHHKVYVQINKGMYGLPQAGHIAFDKLQTTLNTAGFHTHPTTPGLWTHNIHPLSFILSTDDFGIKYVKPEDALYLINTLQTHYPITIYLTGAHFCGFTLQWEYGHKRTVEVTLPNYVPHMLTKYRNINAKPHEHTPYKFTPIAFKQCRSQQPYHLHHH